MHAKYPASGAFVLPRHGLILDNLLDNDQQFITAVHEAAHHAGLPETGPVNANHAELCAKRRKLVENRPPRAGRPPTKNETWGVNEDGGWVRFSCKSVPIIADEIFELVFSVPSGWAGWMTFEPSFGFGRVSFWNWDHDDDGEIRVEVKLKGVFKGWSETCQQN